MEKRSKLHRFGHREPDTVLTMRLSVCESITACKFLPPLLGQHKESRSQDLPIGIRGHRGAQVKEQKEKERVTCKKHSYERQMRVTESLLVDRAKAVIKCTSDRPELWEREVKGKGEVEGEGETGKNRIRIVNARVDSGIPLPLHFNL